MEGRSWFSESYGEARARFRELARGAGAALEAHPIEAPGPQGEELTLDVAWLGPRDAPRVVAVSSGLHGVEGFLGSAVQLSLLQEQVARHDDVALVLLHALNPYGFAWLRRVDAENIDLNRNLLREGEAWEGAPEGYDRFDPLLNPPRPPRALSHLAFPIKALPHLLRYGMPALKTVVAGGQYRFPKGLFHGGSGPSNIMKILTNQVPRWFGAAEHLLQVDFHSGLGERGTYKLLVDHTSDSERARWLTERFGDAVQPWDAGEGVAYAIRGGLGTWMKATLPAAEVDVLCAEFGTVSPIAVITALHCENRAHLYGGVDHPRTAAAKTRLRETFAPSDPTWRDTVLTRGRDIVSAALAASR